MKRCLIILLLLITGTAVSFGQTAAGIVRGQVQDSVSKELIKGADIFLLSPSGRKAIFHTRATTGNYLFQALGGTYHIMIVASGYGNDTVLLSVKNGDTAFINRKLLPVSNELENITIRSTPRPVLVRGDTLAFNADAFAVRPNAQLEDLLRKLPGVEVDKDGNITVQGQKVDKITVNGKDLFLGNIKQANSLPAEMIASVETFASQSERAKFSGVKDVSTTKTLNLKIKKGMENAWFGNAYASKGEGSSYAGGGMATQFGGERMLNSNLKLNNINNRFTGVESKQLGAQSGVQTTQAIELSYRGKWGKKLTGGLSFSGNRQQTDVLQSTSRRSFFSDSSLQENRLSHSLNKTGNYPVNIMLTYDADSMNQLQLVSSVSVQRSRNNSQDTATTQTLLNNGDYYVGSHTQTENNNRQSGVTLNNQFEWRHRFARKGRTLQWSFTQSFHNENNPGGLYTALNTFDRSGSKLQDTVTNQEFSQRTKGNGYGSSVMYTEPITANRSLSFSYGFNTQLEQSDKRSNDYDSTTGQFSKPNALTTNRFDNRNTSHRAEGTFNTTGKVLSYQLGVGWQLNILDNLNFSPDRHINQHFTNLFPRAMANINLGKGKSLSVNYSGASIAPAIDQLQPLPDITNPLLVKMGNPSLKQAFNHSVNASYNAFNLQSFKGIMLSLQADMMRNQIVSSTTLLSGGVQQIQYVNVNGAYHASGMASYNFALSRKNQTRSNGSVITHLRYGHDIGLVNGQENSSNTFTWGQQLKLNYNAGTRFNGDFSGGIDYTGYRYSIRPEQNTQSWNQNAALNLGYECIWGINLQCSYTWIHQGTAGLLPSQSTGVLNAAIFKRLFAAQKWQLRLSGFDLLNTNRNYTQSAAENYIYTRQTNLLQRMFLLSVVYNFRAYSGLKKRMG